MAKILVVDTETGGLDPDIYSIISIGAVVWEDGVIKDEFYRVLKEGDNVEATQKALDVNGFTLEQILEEGTPIDIAMGEFMSFLVRNGLSKRIQLAGHNTQFDVGFIKRWFRMVTSESDYDYLFSYRLLDTMSIAQFLGLSSIIPQLKSYSLDNVAAAFVMKRESEKHDALEDAKLTANLLSKMIEKVKIGVL